MSPASIARSKLTSPGLQFSRRKSPLLAGSMAVPSMFRLPVTEVLPQKLQSVRVGLLEFKLYIPAPPSQPPLAGSPDSEHSHSTSDGDDGEPPRRQPGCLPAFLKPRDPAG